MTAHRIVMPAWGRRAGDTLERLRSAIDTLPHPEKQIVQLAMLGHKTAAEIAVDMRMSEDEVERLAVAVMPMLQQRLAYDR